MPTTLIPLNNTMQLVLVVIDNISIFNFLLKLETSITKLLDDDIVSVLCLIEASDYKKNKRSGRMKPTPFILLIYHFISIIINMIIYHIYEFSFKNLCSSSYSFLFLNIIAFGSFTYFSYIGLAKDTV